MFVFAGFQSESSKDSLPILFERLNKIFSQQQLPVLFTRKDKLLTSRLEDVSFYVSIFNDENEIKDWYQMAKFLMVRSWRARCIHLLNRLRNCSCCSSGIKIPLRLSSERCLQRLRLSILSVFCQSCLLFRGTSAGFTTFTSQPCFSKDLAIQ